MMDVDTCFRSPEARADFARRNPPAPYWLRYIASGKYITVDPAGGPDTIPAMEALRLHASGLAEVIEQRGLAFIRLNERGLGQLLQLEELGVFQTGGRMMLEVPRG